MYKIDRKGQGGLGGGVQKSFTSTDPFNEYKDFINK